MLETDPKKAENPTLLPLWVQPEQPDVLRLADRTVATPSPLSASAEPDQFHQSALAVWADPHRESLSAAESADVGLSRNNHLNALLMARLRWNSSWPFEFSC